MSYKTILLFLITAFLHLGVTKAADETIDICETPNNVFKPLFNPHHDFLPTVNVFAEVYQETITIDLDKTFPPSYIGSFLNIMYKTVGLDSSSYVIDDTMMRGILAVVSQFPIPVFASWGSFTSDWKVLTTLLLDDNFDQCLVDTFVSKYGSIKSINFYSSDYCIGFDYNYITNQNGIQQKIHEKGIVISLSGSLVY